ncbi:MAG: phytanoyl-CoA dioxygenase family protein [Candidatus Hydrogenedentes bacterium]|nr:phytanoyl-CoA dioxygenase family protein [Candidatus Hydrogenedentota bacterium]
MKPADYAAFYAENGYLVVPNLVSQDELARLKQDTADIARGKYPCEGINPLPAEFTDDQVLRTVLCIHQVHFISPVMLEFVKHPGMAEVLTKIIGPDVKCMQSMLFVKPPGFQGQAWHQDEIYIPTRDRSLCGGWIAIDDATVENGCLWVLPGSHRSGYLYPQRTHGENDEFDSAEVSHGFDDSEEVPVEVTAGSVVFFNGYLLHRSKKNRGTGYRRALVNHYMNAYSLLPWSMVEGERTATADRRCVVMVAGKDPYAWKGYETTPNSLYMRVCKAREDALKGLQQSISSREAGTK